MPFATTRSDGWYTPVDPPRQLEPLVACAWTARPSGRHLLTPDACCDILITSASHFVLCGPERRSWTFELPTGTTAVGLRLRPGAAHALFGIDVSSIVDRRIELRQVVGRERAEAIVAQVSGADDLDTGRDALVEAIAVLATERGVTKNDPFAEQVVETLVVDPRARQQTIAAACGVTARQLHRRALTRFGYGTTTLARLLRLQRLLALAVNPSGGGLGRLAAAAGYTDQAHLSRDCRSITGLTPAAFLGEYFPTFPNMSDPYKIGRAFDVTIV